MNSGGNINQQKTWNEPGHANNVREFASSLQKVKSIMTHAVPGQNKVRDLSEGPGKTGSLKGQNIAWSRWVCNGGSVSGILKV